MLGQAVVHRKCASLCPIRRLWSLAALLASSRQAKWTRRCSTKCAFLPAIAGHSLHRRTVAGVAHQQHLGSSACAPAGRRCRAAARAAGPRALPPPCTVPTCCRPPPPCCSRPHRRCVRTCATSRRPPTTIVCIRMSACSALPPLSHPAAFTSTLPLIRWAHLPGTRRPLAGCTAVWCNAQLAR